MGTRLVASSFPSSMASASSASSASSTPWPPRQNANELTSVVPSTSPHPSSRSNCKPRLAELGRPFETPPASHAAHTPSPSERYHAFSASRLPNSRFSTSNASTVNLPCRTKGFCGGSGRRKWVSRRARAPEGLCPPAEDGHRDNATTRQRDNTKRSKRLPTHT